MREQILQHMMIFMNAAMDKQVLKQMSISLVSSIL